MPDPGWPNPHANAQTCSLRSGSGWLSSWDLSVWWIWPPQLVQPAIRSPGWLVRPPGGRRLEQKPS